MDIKKGRTESTDDFWYDLSMGGHLDPKQMCADQSDAQRVIDAVKVIEEFESACTNQIEDFWR